MSYYGYVADVSYLGDYNFIFIGLKAILAVYLADYLSYDEDEATFGLHLFTFFAYTTALLGGWISDSYWGFLLF